MPEAYKLAKELGGKPNEGALEVYRDLESNTISTKHFLDRWKSVESIELKQVIEEVKRIYNSLLEMQKLVDSTPPNILREIKQRLSKNFGYVNEDEKYHSKYGTPVMIVVAVGIIALKYFGILSWSWFLIFPLAIIAGVISAAITSSIILAVRGH